MMINRTDLAIGVAIAFILGGVIAASFTKAYLFAPDQAFAEQGKATGSPLLAEGQKLFISSCAGCHYSDKTEDKGGPGLKGLSKSRKLPSSGREATEQNIIAQLKSPIKTMPKFDRFTEQENESLAAYLLSL